MVEATRILGMREKFAASFPDVTVYLVAEAEDGEEEEKEDNARGIMSQIIKDIESLENVTWVEVM
jgi:LmbE family N-acetylglucosaminyl deacetylase